MPHLSMEFSAGLERRADLGAVCRAAQGAMVESGVFPLAGIRVRAYCADYAIVADGLAENDFLAMTLSVGAGRDTETLRGTGDLIFAAVREVLSDPLATAHFSLSLEIREINPDLSWKANPIHARLSAGKATPQR